MPRTKEDVKKINRSKKGEDLMDFNQFVDDKPKNAKSWAAIMLIVVIFLLLGILFYVYNNDDLEKEFKYKAISLEGDQVYYAKVVREDTFSIYLDDVFYIQTQQQQIPPQEEDGEPQVVNVPVLIHRGDEFHKPQGLLQISRSKLIAIEEIGEDSEILLEINRIKGLE